MTTIRSLSLALLLPISACVFGSDAEIPDDFDDAAVRDGLLDLQDDADEPPAVSVDGCPVSQTPLECDVFVLVNVERTDRGLPVLEYDNLLAEAAHGHAQDMSARGYFAHSSPEGESPGDRIEEVGYDHRGWAENIARGQVSAEDVMNSWMNSDGHRANILNPGLEEIGVGYVSSGRFWVQKFGIPAR